MQLIRDYLKQVSDKYSTGEAKEHAYRGALETLLQRYGGKDVQALNDSVRIEGVTPDFVLRRGQVPLGYVEAKDVNVDLKRILKTDQLKGYLDAFGNLVLTDYLEFHWFVKGQLKLSARIAAPQGNKLAADSDGIEALDLLLKSFLEAKVEIIGRPGELAARMANLARQIRTLIKAAFAEEGKQGALHDQFESFRETLLDSLTPEQFADMYAQTICYGMFAARAEHAGPRRQAGAGDFTRVSAAHYLPRTNPFLRKLFGHIAGPELDERISWVVDDLAELLRRAQMDSILSEFGNRKGGEDPVVHFYESFLAAYDPKMREARGVYYTPEPVVSYIVRSVDHILKTEFGLPDGLADSSMVDWPGGARADGPSSSADGASSTSTKDNGPSARAPSKVHRVQILDPAVGTGSFLFGVVDQIHQSFKGRQGQWSGYVKDHLLPRLHGFELLMAPYAVAHLKLGLQLAETGYEFDSDERLGVYLTNTLDEPHLLPTLGSFGRWLTEEAEAANKVKRDLPVLVILGNPPYSGISTNTGSWITTILQSYFVVDGLPLGEKKVWLNDDYVKFIRWAQWRIDRTGSGILAFICNHAFLDNPTFRGMRQSLMHSFDSIRIINLHGNKNRKEKVPAEWQIKFGVDVSDENVFDIRQGVCIVVASKHKTEQIKPLCDIQYLDYWGRRDAKYEFLTKSDICSTSETIYPSKRFYMFIPSTTDEANEFESFIGLNKAFVKQTTGLVTARDAFAIDFDPEAILNRVNDLTNTDLDTAELRLKYFSGKSSPKYPPGDTRGWKLDQARSKLRAILGHRSNIQNLLYKPFDTRAIYYSKILVDWPRFEVLPNMLKPNLALLYMRQVALDEEYSHFLVTEHLADNRAMYSNKGILTVAPLFVHNSRGDRESNLSPTLVTATKALAEVSGSSLSPEDIFNYMYAVFHSPEYRRRYAEFLKRDFPRLPLTSDLDLFRGLCDLGGKLVALHLMREGAIDAAAFPLPDYPVAHSDKASDGLVEKVSYSGPQNGARDYVPYSSSATDGASARGAQSAPGKSAQVSRADAGN